MTTTPQAALLSDDEIEQHFENNKSSPGRELRRRIGRDIEDAILSKLQATQEPVQAGELPDGMALVVEKLQRFQECSEDSDAGGCDIGRDWFDALTTIGLLRRVQRSPGLWEMTLSGSAVLARAALSARKPLTDMDRAVLRMPMDMAFGDELGRFQFYQRVQGLLDRIDGIGLEVKP